MTNAVAEQVTERVYLRCVVCGRCNAGVSGDFAEVRIFTHCRRCAQVTEAVRSFP